MASDVTVDEFQNIVWQHFELYGRHDLPWRIPEADGSFDPYKILVSEIMLQQTQVPRVLPKFLEFLETFPSVLDLSRAPLSAVLTAWSGLGYNRRAKFLWQAAQRVAKQSAGNFPETMANLVSLPGVGKNTAGAIMAYAYNQPALFIETNIRTVYIYHFFQGRDDVSDAEILAVLTQSLPVDSPRTFYWALMDYGTFLKQTIGNLNKLSKTYAKQSPFEGSKRQIRGKVIKLLSVKPLSKSHLKQIIADDRLELVLDDLTRETMIKKSAGVYCLC